MYSEYQYLISRGRYESDGFGSHIYGFVKSIDDGYNFIINEYIKFIEKFDVGYKNFMTCEEQKELIDDIKGIERLYDEINENICDLNEFNDYSNLLEHRGIVVLSSKFFGFEYIITKINSGYIQNQIDKFDKLCLEERIGLSDNKDDFYQINIRSIYLIKVKTPLNIDMINIIQTTNKFIRYRAKYLNIVGNICMEEDGFITYKSDPNASSHMYIFEKVNWFLENHFRPKVIDNQLLETNINQSNDFVIGLNDMGFDLDLDILYAKYNIKFIY